MYADDAKIQSIADCHQLKSNLRLNVCMVKRLLSFNIDKCKYMRWQTDTA